MKAYLLVKFAPDADVSNAIHALKQPAVLGIDLVIGPYDAVVRVHADDYDGLAELTRRVRRCPGVRDTVTYPVIESSEGAG